MELYFDECLWPHCRQEKTFTMKNHIIKLYVLEMKSNTEHNLNKHISVFNVLDWLQKIQ